MYFLKSKFAAVVVFVLTLSGVLTSCDNDTNDIGMNVMPKADLTNTVQALYNAYSQSIKIDSLVANTSQCYLGKVTDPETGSTTICNFAAQFYRNEEYKMPAKKYMTCDANGDVICDSVTLTLYIQSYYGDSLSPIKFAVYEMDSLNVMEENKNYYTNFDPEPYLSKKTHALYKESTFAVVDLEVSDSIRSLESYTRNVTVKLPVTFGARLINTYYSHPEYYKNTYTYTHNVLPGFYFKCLSGNGVMLSIDATVLSCYFTYTIDDSTYVGIERVAATEEVLQNNTISNSGIDSLMANTSCTYLKTPAGIFTEVTLPVDEIYDGHEKDSVNSAKVVFQRINNDALRKYNLATAAKILMLPKSEFGSFFEDKKLADGTKEFVASFNSSYNSYTFENISTLVSWMRKQMISGAGISSSDDAATKQSKHDRWVTDNPDWNKVILVPVVTETNSSGSYTKIRNEFELTSVKLVGGADSPIQVSVIYSHFSE